MENKFIVAEVSKTWVTSSQPVNLLSQKFELVINTNLSRGYELRDWKLSVVADGGKMNETIIAIFEYTPNPSQTTPAKGD